MTCRRVRDWLHRDAASLDDAQRLLLDDHLAACERCRGDRRRMQLVRQVGAALTAPPAESRVYGRAISRALLQPGTARPSAHPRRWPALAALAAAGIAIAVIAVGARRGRGAGETARAPTESTSPGARSPLPAPVATAPGEQPPAAPSVAPTPSPAAPPAVALDRIEGGSLTSRSVALPRGSEVPANAPLRASARAQVRLASLRVVIAAHSELRWVPAERMVILDRGRLEIESVAPGAARVVAERFEIELDDAALTVDPGSVRVRRGAARIVDRSRRVLAKLGAGSDWKPPGPARSALPPAAQTTATPSDEAEAAMVLAEAAQARGALDLAVARYLAVATEFPDHPAAESALYAAARVELQRSRPDAARSILAHYLDRYPQGRYADDARRALAGTP